MKVTIEIDDNELKEIVIEKIAGELASECLRNWSHDRRVVSDLLEKGMLKYVLDDKEALKKRAVNIAAEKIAYGSRKMLFGKMAAETNGFTGGDE